MTVQLGRGEYGSDLLEKASDAERGEEKLLSAYRATGRRRTTEQSVQRSGWALGLESP